MLSRSVLLPGKTKPGSSLNDVETLAGVMPWFCAAAALVCPSRNTAAMTSLSGSAGMAAYHSAMNLSKLRNTGFMFSRLSGYPLVVGGWVVFVPWTSVGRILLYEAGGCGTLVGVDASPQFSVHRFWWLRYVACYSDCLTCGLADWAICGLLSTA